MMISVSRKLLCTISLLGLAVSANLAAQPNAAIQAQQLQLQQQRTRAQERRDAASAPDIRMAPTTPAGLAYPPQEAPCFTIQKIVFDGPSSEKFQWALKASSDARGRCLGTAGINVIISRVQNALVGAGFITSRIVVPPQDLRLGTLLLTFVPGRIRNVTFSDVTPGTTSHPPALPLRKGAWLNLRDIEQGLENLKRVPSADADVQIVPGDDPGESDLLIFWRQARPWRVNLALDDGGNRATGKYQANVTLSVDNPFGLNDQFYASVSHDVGGNGAAGGHGTSGHSLHYSLPFAYWLLVATGNDYAFRQSVAGEAQSYIYSGDSRKLSITLSRLLYRDAVRKFGVSLSAYQHVGNNFIDDTEVEVQRRRTGGFEVGLNGKYFMNSATVDGSIMFKRGSGAFGNLDAFDAVADDGSSRPRVIHADAGLTLPFTFKRHQFSYQANWRAQWNRTGLTAQDRFGIGGRYTVRGFDGESSLLAERGWLVRNELALHALRGQQIYFFADYAQVGGPARRALAGRRLGGAGLGWRGQWQGLQYDLFAGKPVVKPERFRSARVTSGFNLSYSF